MNLDNISNGDIFQILKEISVQNLEIKSDIKQIKEDLSIQVKHISLLNNKVKSLEDESKEVKEKLYKIQRNLKRNNIAVFGITESDHPIIEHFITLIKDKLGINIEETEIDNIYRIGKKEDNKVRPVIVELVRNIRKQEIIKKAFKLKGTGITIRNDLTPEEKEEHHILNKHLKAAREKKSNAKISRNKLIVNGEFFTAAQLEKSSELPARSRTPEKRNNTLQKNNSAPTTPSIVNFPNNDRGFSKEEEKTRREKKQPEAEKLERNKKEQTAGTTKNSQTITTRSNTKKPNQTESPNLFRK